jgi:hypothetical protein
VLGALSRASTAGIVPLQLEAELTLAEVVARSSERPSRMAAELQREAETRGFVRIASAARRLAGEFTAPRISAHPSALSRR